MHSWIFRNRRRLEAIYDAPGRSLARPGRSRDRQARSGAPPAAAPASGARGPRGDCLMVYELYPRIRRRAA